MTRDQYLEQLAAALDFMEEEARAAALSFYAEMLDDRMEDGMEEEAAVAAMDDIQAIAQRLKHEQPKAKEDIFTIVAEQTREVAQEALKAAEGVVNSVNTFANAAVGRAEGAYNAIRDEIQKGEEGEYDQHQFTCPGAGIRSISLTAQDLPIRIFPSPDDQIHLTYYSCENDVYTAFVENGVLTLSHLGGSRKKGFHFSLFNWGQMKILWHQSSPTIELALPPDSLCDLAAATSNGSIRAEGMNALCDTILRTSNSRISLEHTQCKSLDMQTSNARLILDHVQCKSFIRGRTSNGRIEGSCIHAAGEITLVTSNGRIQMEHCAARAPLSLITSNGAIEVHGVTGPDVTLRTSNGAIRGTLPGPITDWQIDSATSNGRNSLPGYQPGNKPLSVRTANGNIDISFE